MINFDFTGRVAVVTGGGMGLEIANIILEAGGAVVMIDVKSQPENLRGDESRYLFV